MSYIHCPYCGQRALAVATQCPHCARAFESRFWKNYGSGPRRRRRIPAGVIILMGVGALVALSAVQGELQLSVGPPALPSASLADSVPRPLPKAAAKAKPRAAPPQAQPLAAAVKPESESKPSATQNVAAAPPPAAAVRMERRYANTWVNLRARRSGAAPVVRVLKPGETVLVDSLRQGWYRAVADGETVGYVDRDLVGTAPRSPGPDKGDSPATR